MARIRSVSPDLRTSETTAAWPREARYAWVLLWGYCDDYGRGLDNVKVIAADLFPLDDDVSPDLMGEWLSMFEESGAICRYEEAGKRYLHCVNWGEYQRPQHPGKVRIPPCPEHEPVAHDKWSQEHSRSTSGKSHESRMRVSPTRGRGSKEMSKEVSKEKEGERGNAEPPRFPDHCPAHANVAVPGPCGSCKDARKAYEQQQPRLQLIPSVSARPDWCGTCNQFTRQLETPVGVIRCPACHPLAEEAS